MKRLISSSVSILFVLVTYLMICPAQLHAQIVQLTWDPSVSNDVAGYKIYYKAASSELPLDGVEALEGPSPIDVGNVTSFTLSELPEGSVYYFRASAYDSASYESSLSNLATSEWIPATLAPAMNETVGSSAVLVWSTPPDNLDLSFTLLFGTDPNLKINSKAKGKRRNKKNSVIMPTLLINGLADTSYTTTDLYSKTTYYWQVIATDSSGQKYSSIINSFVTE